MAVTVKQEVAALYSAIFNRAPDQAGLEFWVEAINGGDSLTKAAEGFTQHPVFAEVYGDLSNQAKVETLYTNVLGSAGDAAGIQFWVAKLESGVSFGQVVAEFVSGALTIDLDALLASGELSETDYAAAVVRQNSITNKADAGVYFADTFGAASNLSASTDATTKEGLESDPVYLASQAAIAGVTNDAATLAAAKAAIDAAEVPTDLNVVPAPVFTLTEALAAETLPEGYVLSDATADLGALAVADVAAAQAAAAEVVAGAANAAELELAATYTIADTLANVLAADAAVLADAASYSLTDAAGALGELTEAQIAVVQGAANVADYTYTVEFTLTAGLAGIEAANQAVENFLAGLELEWNYDADGNAQNIVEVGDATEGNVNSDLADAVSEYDAAVDAASSSVDATEITSAYATQSVGVRSAILADAQAEVAEALATAEKNLADRDAAIAKVAGLTEALAASAAADEALQAAKDAVAAQYEATTSGFTVAQATAIATLEANLNALADVSLAAVSDNVPDGEYGNVVDSEGDTYAPQIADAITLTSTKLGAITLASYDADVNRLVLTSAADVLAADATTEQKALFAEYQALAATVISQANASYVAHENLTALDEAAVDAARELSYVDADAAVTSALNALAAANVFTLTEIAGPKPTLTEVKAEIAALTNALAEATQLSNDADAAEATALTSATSALNTVATLDDTPAAETAAYDILNGEGTVIGSVNLDGTVSPASDGSLGGLSSAQATALQSLADLVKAAVAAETAETAATVALGDFTDLVYADSNSATTTLYEALDVNKLAVVNGDPSSDTDDYSVLESAIVGVQAKIDNLNAAIADLAEAEGNREELTALQKAVTDAEEVVVTESGFDVLNNVDSASEFGTAKNDLFLAGTVNSTIYSASLQGDDALFVGTNVTYNAAVIGAGEGEVALAKAGDVSALEFFLEETNNGVNVYIETKAYGSETGDFTTITLSGQTLAGVTVDGGLLTIA